MAIVDHPGFPCWSARHQLTPPPMAVAIIRRTNSPDRPLEPRCQPCVDQLAQVDAHYVVIYLDPTRQRRPQPDDYDRTAAAVKRTFTLHWTPVDGTIRPDPAV